MHVAPQGEDFHAAVTPSHRTRQTLLGRKRERPTSNTVSHIILVVIYDDATIAYLPGFECYPCVSVAFELNVPIVAYLSNCR